MNNLLRDPKTKAIVNNNQEELNRILRERQLAEDVELIKKRNKRIKDHYK